MPIARKQTSLQPPIPTPDRKYDSFGGQEGDSVEEISDAGAIKLEKGPFAWSTYCDVYAGKWTKANAVVLDVCPAYTYEVIRLH